MQCPLCQAENPPTAISCAKCSTPLPLDDRTLGATMTGGTAPPSATPRGTSAWSVAVTPPPDAPYAQGEALIGTLLAERYEILELLGQGGMGAVYKAHDIELERLVALKLIRPDLASNPEILRRFKQELILAREVTHRNVIRIFDLGQAKGFKFITMEFVEGRDLRAILRERGKLPPEEAVRIISQVCRALESAHAAGVVHRDLKPQNIMLDAKDRVYVMDFGIAHSLETPGMTQTGALMGTPEYMSPEQAKGIKVDPRSDLFSLGIIFYELLSGISPFKADTALATLLKRTQERAQPPAEVDPTIPKAISDVVMKCLEIDRDLRFSTAREILEDLGQEMPTSVRTVAPTLPPLIPTPKAGEISPFVRYRTWIAVGAAFVVLAGLAVAFRGKLFPAKIAAPVEQASLAILPFRNASGDASLDWLGPSLADMLSTDVGQSARLRTISPDRLHQVLADLRITSGTAIDPTMVGRIAEFSNADTVVWGQYAKFGDQIRIDATLQDLKHNRRAPLKIEAASEKEIPGTVDVFAELIRKNLAVSPDVLKELKASSFQPSSKSVPALRDYNQGVQLLRDGKNLEAVKTLQAAVQADSQFALAYSRLAETESALGYDTEAEKYSRKALDLSQQLPLAEKYLIEASHARVMKDTKKAIEAYENLAKSAPGNIDIQHALGKLYLDMGDYKQARAHYSSVLKTEPKNLDALSQMGWLEVQNGQPQSGLDPLNRALSLAVEVDNQEQKAQVLVALGTAYQAMNKPEEALHNFEQARDLNLRLGKKGGVANSLDWMGNVQSTLGKLDLALANYTEALKLQREIGAKSEAANTLISMGALFAYGGQLDKALELFKESLQIQRDVGDESNQAVCLNNIGGIYERQGKNDDALTYYQQSLQLREKLGAPADVAESLGNVAEVYAKTAQFDQAMSSYMRALDIRHKAADNHGAALESDGIGVVFLYQGRFGAAVSSLQEAVRGFREAQDRSENMLQTLNDFGEGLANAGRGAEAAKILEEAQSLAAELKNDERMSGVLNTRGDVLLYGGDFKGAKSLYQQGLQSAYRAKAQENILVLKLNLAEVAIAEGRSQPAMGDLRAIVQQADSLDFEYLSLEGSTELAEALIKNRNYSQALQELQTALGKSEKLGTRFLTLRIHYLFGNALRLSGNATEASDHYRQTFSLLDEMKKEPGAEHLLDRSDLYAIYEDATRWSHGG
jgi:tetratricopeptide (TPR) repeat protein/predicted Ser/Thr protein kinase